MNLFFIFKIHIYENQIGLMCKLVLCECVDNILKYPLCLWLFFFFFFLLVCLTNIIFYSSLFLRFSFSFSFQSFLLLWVVFFIQFNDSFDSVLHSKLRQSEIIFRIVNITFFFFGIYINNTKLLILCSIKKKKKRWF